MLKRFLGLLCLLFFFGGSGLYSYLFNFDMDFVSYYEHLLSKFINELLTSNNLEGGGGRTAEEITPILEVYLGLSDEPYPDDVMRVFHGRKIVQIVFSSLFFFLGLWLFKSSYKSKNKPEDSNG